jgi:putative transposase
MIAGVKQRYRYRLYPHPHQQLALAKAFGCGRVVWNDALAKSRELYAAGEKTSYPVLAKLCIIQAKQIPERSLLSGPSNVVQQQQSVRDLDQAFRNWWASLSGKRKGPKVRAPRFNKRRGAQAIQSAVFNLRTSRRQEGVVDSAMALPELRNGSRSRHQLCFEHPRRRTGGESKRAWSRA